jgi:peptidoglycan/xylan/chitin deacetylase (PgdA/CDA1 family)
MKLVSSLRFVSLTPILVLLLSLASAVSGAYQLARSEHPLQPTAFVSHSQLVKALTLPEIQLQDMFPDYAIPPISDGLAPVLTTIPTTQPVVFLGIDDGQDKLPTDLPIMKYNRVKASLFLADHIIKDNPAFFKDFISAGSYVEDHSVNHVQMSKLSYTQQRQEICNEADLQTRQFGRRPILFRPPYGDYNNDTRRAAADCGMKAVVLWIAKANGGSMQYQVGDHLRPGDIVLMHFRPEFAQDMQAFVDAEKAAGLHTVLLEDWVQG